MNIEKSDNFYTSKRLIFRGFRAEDVEDVFEYASDPEVTKFLTWPSHSTVSQTRQVLDTFYIGQELCFAVVVKKEQKCIGSITINLMNAQSEATLGFVLNKKYWNQGFGTEVVKWALRYAFLVKNVELVKGEHFIGNNPSGRVMERAGMLRQGNEVRSNGKSVVVYSLSKSQWSKLYKHITVLMVNPPSLTEIPDYMKGISYYEWQKTKNHFYSFVPGELLGMQCIQSYIEEQNINCKVEIINGCVEQHTSLKETLEKITEKLPADVLCFTGPYSVFKEVLYLATRVKELNKDIKIIYGQYFASLCYEQILKKYSVFDYISVGYGEVTISQFINFLQGQCPLHDVPGIAYTDTKNKVVMNKIDKNLLDEIIHVKPKRDSIDKVIESGLNVSIFASRGCLYRCSFCATGSLMAKEKNCSLYRLREPIEVVDELEELVDKYHINKITIVDDTFAANTKSAKEQAKIIAEEIIRRDIHIEIMIDTRIDCIEENLFSLLHKAGVRYAYVGIEAGNDTNLKTYNKGYSSSKILENLLILKKVNIKPVYGFITFNPESTIADLKSNIELIDNLDHTDPVMLSNEFVPYPGLTMTNELLKKGYVVGEFPDYKNNYKYPEVYKVKKTYDKLLAIYLAFLMNMNKDPAFDIKKYPIINKEIMKLFTSFMMELINGLYKKADEEIDSHKKEYEQTLRELLRCILKNEITKQK